MTPELEARIRAVFSAGLDRTPDETQFDWTGPEQGIEALGHALSPIGMRVERVLRWKCEVWVKITISEGPSYESWQAENNESRLRYLSDHGDSFVVLSLKLSLVDRYYQGYLNAWRPRGSTGYLDCGRYGSPSDAWQVCEKLVDDALHKVGYKQLTHEQYMEPVPFVMNLGYYLIHPDDPCWDDDDFEPPLVPSTLYSCLFEDE